MMKIDKRYAYGLDLSMACSGISILNMDTLEPVLITSIKTNANQSHGERLHEQRELIRKVADKFPPEVVYIEKGFTNFNTATQVIYRVVGVFNEVLHNYKQDYFAPTTVKKTITGNGRSSKEELQEGILNKYPDIKFRNTDESDSMGVVLTGMIKKQKMEWKL